MKYKCGMCGGLGHNRTTCRATKPTFPPTSHTSHQSYQKPTLNSTVGQVFDAVAHKTRPTILTETLAVKETEPAVMTVEEIQTWWALVSTPGETEEEEEVVANLASFLTNVESAGVSATEIKKFVNTFDRSTKQMLAYNENSSRTVIDILSCDVSGIVRAFVAERKDLSSITARRLLFDCDRNVFTKSLTTTTNFSEHDLTQVYTYWSDEDSKEKKAPPHLEWRVHLLGQKNCPKVMLERTVGEYLSLKQNGSFVSAQTEKEYEYAIQHPKTPAHLLGEAFKMEGYRSNISAEKLSHNLVRILANPATPPAIVEKVLFDHEHMEVVSGGGRILLYSACMRNPALSETKIREEYRKCRSRFEGKLEMRQLLYAFLYNPSTPDDVLSSIVEWVKEPYFTLAVNKILAGRQT